MSFRNRIWVRVDGEWVLLSAIPQAELADHLRGHRPSEVIFDEILHYEDSAIALGFRRRCGWCGVQLRWWQLNLCRTCKAHVADPYATAPYPQKSRWNSKVDRFRARRKKS